MVSQGIERSRMADNKQYQLFIQWEDENSRLAECKYCHYFEDNETIRQYTDDIRKYNFEREVFVFPTNSDMNKKRILMHIFKEMHMFNIEIQLNGDTCCHYFTFLL
jgi:hypothetical protein